MSFSHDHRHLISTAGVRGNNINYWSDMTDAECGCYTGQTDTILRLATAESHEIQKTKASLNIS